MSQTTFRHICIFGALAGVMFIVCATCLAFIHAHNGKDGDGIYGHSALLPATNNILVTTGAAGHDPILTLTRGERVLAVRQTASISCLDPVFIAAAQFLADAPAIARQSMEGGDQAHNAEILIPLLPQDGATAPRLFAALPQEHGDALDSYGHPLRWRVPANVLGSYSIPRPAIFEMPPPDPEPEPVPSPALSRALARLQPAAKAGHYRELVENFSRRYNLNASLVMAIIHSESDFTPHLVSNKSAMGLMQLLPSTASDEVHRFLYGRRGQVSFEQLRVPEINIRYGTAYLHILHNRYFANVQNRQVQEYCVVASYNLGPNRFLRLYGPTNELAVEKINSIEPGEFYEDLARRLPARETRFFVEKVRRMKQHYSALK